MAGRTRPTWAVMVGGPRDGQRQILAPHETQTFRVYALAAPGVGIAHEYGLTAERISAKEWRARQAAAGYSWAMSEGGGRIARYVGTEVAPSDVLFPAPMRSHGTPHFVRTEPEPAQPPSLPGGERRSPPACASTIRRNSASGTPPPSAR